MAHPRLERGRPGRLTTGVRVDCRRLQGRALPGRRQDEPVPEAVAGDGLGDRVGAFGEMCPPFGVHRDDGAGTGNASRSRRLVATEGQVGVEQGGTETPSGRLPGSERTNRPDSRARHTDLGSATESPFGDGS